MSPDHRGGQVRCQGCRRPAEIGSVASLVKDTVLILDRRDHASCRLLNSSRYCSRTSSACTSSSARVTACTVRIRARGRAPSAICPGCGSEGRRVHSRYERRLCDTAISNQQTVVHLQVGRFFCDDGVCGKRTLPSRSRD
ncbi:transposase family protein [Streptomyces chartreusis]|uniref:transposase family protein n=1 Tax=Streptomyces chartreusis TaxID=1969 RepID=UPI0038046861